MTIMKKLNLSTIALAGIAALLLLGGVLVNGTVSAMTGTRAAASCHSTSTIRSRPGSVSASTAGRRRT
jgi:hypothetical protein